MDLNKLAVAVLFFMSLTACDYVMGRTITVKVVDNNGEPVSGAKVEMGFFGHPGTGNGEEVTNEDGVASRRGNDSLGVRTIVTKDGYYKSEKRIGGEGSVTEEILLREKRNPIPMYVKATSLFIPKIGETYGFDFSEGDLVGPYGSGSEADIFLTLEGVYQGTLKRKSRLKIEFKGGKGGLKPLHDSVRYSRYKFPYKAPKGGYKPTRELFFNRDGGNVETNRDRHKLGYAFMVVEDSNADGEIKKEHYGKILEYFRFSPGENEAKNSEGYIGFTYYYNPNPNDRNIEFDPSRNLFDDAKKTFPP